MVFGSARVSKGEEQDMRMQETALRAAGVDRTFTERASGGRCDRPQLHRLLDQLRPDDVVVVWQLDRLSRSLKDLLPLMERIEHAGAGFRSLTEAIDTTTPAGRMLMQMVGSFAGFERAMLRERMQADATRVFRVHPATVSRLLAVHRQQKAHDPARPEDVDRPAGSGAMDAVRPAVDIPTRERSQCTPLLPHHATA